MFENDTRDLDSNYASIKDDVWSGNLTRINVGNSRGLQNSSSYSNYYQTINVDQNWQLVENSSLHSNARNLEPPVDFETSENSDFVASGRDDFLRRHRPQNTRYHRQPSLQYPDHNQVNTPVEDYDADPLVSLKTLKIAESPDGYLVRKMLLQANVELNNDDDALKKMANEEYSHPDQFNELKKYVKSGILKHDVLRENLERLFLKMQFVDDIEMKSFLQHRIQYILLKVFIYPGKCTERTIKSTFTKVLEDIKASLHDLVGLPKLINLGLMMTCCLINKKVNWTELKPMILKFKGMQLIDEFKGSRNDRLLTSFQEMLKNIVQSNTDLPKLCIGDWRRSLADPEMLEMLLGLYKNQPLEEQIFLLTRISALAVELNVLPRLQEAYRSHHSPHQTAPCVLVTVVWNAGKNSQVTLYPGRDRRYSAGLKMDTESQDNLLKVLHCIDSKSRYGYALLGMGKEFRMQCINADCIEEGIKRRIEKDLDILGVEIIDKKELRSTDTQYTYQNSTPVWKTIHCKLLGCFGKCRILIPSLQCLTEEPDSNYKEKATPKETKENLNELDILIRLHYRGPHDYIAQLFVHQLIPIPILYIVEAKGENLYTHLMEIRNRKMKILSIPSLLNIFLEAVKAVQFVHDKAIIHRDLTTRSFEIYDTSSSERMSIKLSSFKIAKLLWQEGEPVQRETIDRSCDQIPTLWSSPESHKSGVYGKMSDNWTVALLGYEMFNHGAWPYWIEEDISYDDVITQIIFHERPPSQPKNMPDPVCRILQKTLMSKPNDRKKLEEIEEEIVTIMQSMSLLKQKNYTQYKELEDIWASSELPPITREQESMSSNIKRGTPKEILEYRKEFGEPEQLYDSYTAFCDLQTGKRIVVVRENDITSEFKTTRTLRDGTLEVIEQVSQKFSSKDREHLKTLNKDALSIISEIWPPDVRFPENKDTVMYECPSGTSLFKIVMDAYFGDTIDGYIPILHNLACLLKYLHDNSWTANCLRARNVYINDDYLNNFVERDLKVFIPNLGYFTKNADSSGLYDFACAERDIALTYCICRTTLPVARFIDAPAHGISTKNSICSDYRWTASNSAHVHASGRLDLVVGQAPEVIASSMFSPFSDVFSFSRLLSEICVILDITRKKTSHRYSAARIELKSVPCGNIERNNILRYINNGKIPKKHDSCSDWLWDDVMVPSLSIQRFERPTMADIIEIIEKHSKGLQRPMFSLTEETLVKQVFNQVPYAVAKKGYKRPKSVRREASTLYTRSSGSEPDSKQQNTMSSSGYAQVSEAKHYQNVSESSPTMRK